MTNPYVGSSLDEYLEEEGIAEEVTLAALRTVLAWMLLHKHPAMRRHDMTDSFNTENPPPSIDERSWDGS